MIKNIYYKNKSIVRNFLNLTLINAINILVPIVIIPKIILSIGLENYGEYAFHQGVVAFFSVLINFGFYAVAPRDISINRSNADRINEIVSSVIYFKIFLWVASLIVILVIGRAGFFNVDFDLLIITYFLSFYELFFVSWFFQGIERLSSITIINAVSKVSFLVLVYGVIDKQSSVYDVALVQSLVTVSSSLIVLLMMFRQYNVRLVKVKLKSLSEYIQNCAPVFFSNITNTIRDRGLIILVGTLIGKQYVALYDIGLRFLNLFSTPFSIFVDAVFPKISREGDVGTTVKMILVLMGICSSLSLMVFVIGQELVLLVDDWVKYKEVLYFILIFPFSILSLVVGRLLIIPFGDSSDLLFSSFVTTALFIISSLFIYLLDVNVSFLEVVVFAVFLNFVDAMCRILFFNMRRNQ